MESGAGPGTSPGGRCSVLEVWMEWYKGHPGRLGVWVWIQAPRLAHTLLISWPGGEAEVIYLFGCGQGSKR